jgi:hypothetical protein
MTVCTGNLGSGTMFRVTMKYAMFDLQAVLLMCWMNHVNDKTNRRMRSQRNNVLL